MPVLQVAGDRSLDAGLLKAHLKAQKDFSKKVLPFRTTELRFPVFFFEQTSLTSNDALWIK